MASVRCPNCNLPNPPSRAACARCRTDLGTRTGGGGPSPGGGLGESSASILYLVALVLSCAGGGGVIALAQWLMGDDAMQSDLVLIGGFMVGTLGSLGAMVWGISRWKNGPASVRPAQPEVPEERASRKELLVGAALVAAAGVFLVWYFVAWEQEGGERRINAVAYGLYMLLGKWGLGALFWISSAVMIWKGVTRD